ncbi:hypothetical protein CsSME_00052989 [Camellia sinensis var. sinensis]
MLGLRINFVSLSTKLPLEGTASLRCHERVARTDIDTVALPHTLSPWSPWSRGLRIMARIKP